MKMLIISHKRDSKKPYGPLFCLTRMYGLYGSVRVCDVYNVERAVQASYGSLYDYHTRTPYTHSISVYGVVRVCSEGGNHGL